MIFSIAFSKTAQRRRWIQSEGQLKAVGELHAAFRNESRHAQQLGYFGF
jgi:hypothetical protein